MRDIAEFLFENRANNTDPGWLADVLGKLVWRVDDNGCSIHKSLESWIIEGDLEHAKVALVYDEALLFQSHAESEAALLSLESRFPQLKETIQGCRSRWAEAVGRPNNSSKWTR